MTRKILMTAMTAMVLSFSPVTAQAADAPAFTDAQKKELDTMMRDYMMNNGKLIMDAVDKYRQDQQNAEEKAFDDKIKARSSDLYKDSRSPAAGNKDGDVTLVEFFDYNCGYCKHAFKDLQTLMNDDKKLKVVFKDIPILSESSLTAALYALASHKQGKYWEYHSALMEHTGQLNDEVLQSVGKTVGLDVEKLKKDAQDPEIRSTIEANLALARDLGINGTPAFVVGDKALRGAYGLDAMKKAVEDTRAATKK